MLLRTQMLQLALLDKAPHKKQMVFDALPRSTGCRGTAKSWHDVMLNTCLLLDALATAVAMASAVAVATALEAAEASALPKEP